MTIYSHVDAAGGPAGELPASSEEVVDVEDPSSWGQGVRFSRGRPIVFERDLGAGHKVVTFVIWAE